MWLIVDNGGLVNLARATDIVVQREKDEVYELLAIFDWAETDQTVLCRGTHDQCKRRQAEIGVILAAVPLREELK